MGVDAPAKEFVAAPRFMLIEPSIEGPTGHHLEYAVCVLRAAAEAGYEPLLATNRRFPLEGDAFAGDAFAGDGAQSRGVDVGRPYDVTRDCAPSPFATSFVTYRQYRYGFWSQPFFSGLGPMRWLYRRLRRSSASGISSCATAVPAVPSATGVPPVLHEERGQDARATGLLRRAAACWRQGLADPIRVLQFARDTQSLIGQIGLRADDSFFLPGAGEIELEGLAQLFARSKDASRATWHLLFRRDPPTPDAFGGAHARLIRALRRIEPECRAGRVRLYTDTEELSRKYEELACGLHVGQVANLPHEAIRFRTLPIPHTDAGPVEPRGEETGTGTSPSTTTIAASPLGSEPVPVSSRPLHVLYLGDARREKGYHHLPRIVADLWDDCLAAGQMAMTIQSNPALTDDEPQITAARERLRSYAGTAVALIDEPLSSSAYRRLLWSGDLVLLPYDWQAYRWRSSGILVEALAAGIPAIAPAGTWLARQLTGEALGATYDDVREIPDIVRRIVADYGRYRQASQAFAFAWRERHNAASLVAMLSAGCHA